MNQTSESLSRLARAAMARGDWPGVEQAARELIQHWPQAAEGHFLFGKVCKAAQRPNQAIEAFSAALQMDPARYDAGIELADQCTIAKDNARSRELLERFRDALDNSPRYLDMAATCYVNIGLPEEALPLYAKAVALQPEIDLFRANLAACSVYTGDIDQAAQLYAGLLEQNPHHQRNHYQLSRLRRAQDSTHIDAMLASLAHTRQPEGKNIFMYYALGKEYEDLGEWDAAFSYYQRAGDAATRAANYTLDEDVEIIETAIASCSATWFREQQPAEVAPGPQPIFILGLPRTGSTLSERMLGAHSQVDSVGETQFLPVAVRMSSQVADHRQMTPAMIAGAARAPSADIAREYLQRIGYRLGDEPWFIEKLPYNSLFLGLIAKAFPAARMIVVERDPMDACFAMYKQVFTWAYKYSYDLENLGHYYCHYARLMDHWREQLGERLHFLRYESLVADPEAELRRALDYLGLPFEAQCLEFHRSRAASTTASSVQVREKIHGDSVGRWHNFEAQLEPLRRIFDANGIEYR
ncbi:sulfotransferase family protein [Mangrovimicrobium sediminis]|uniref:Sulfotransferase family protein n=1 Tax=Mangrovimicrobium sediminis TaxID=2562682 RepID=A0A4Z0M0B1_9GAMM|nr:tetratricopeptide repeat-containing sulfotransferase family protein [Haliea sp. SAOS-164]TGD72959.1 sulfotransferase family protein [Haliea sp. SAOS-164]